MLGLNAARLYDIEVPVECRLAPQQGTPAARDDSVAVTAESPSA